MAASPPRGNMPGMAMPVMSGPLPLKLSCPMMPPMPHGVTFTPSKVSGTVRPMKSSASWASCFVISGSLSFAARSQNKFVPTFSVNWLLMVMPAPSASRIGEPMPVKFGSVYFWRPMRTLTSVCGTTQST